MIIHTSAQSAIPSIDSSVKSKADVRKIIHIDADCFYAAIEMRDDPNLRNRPIAVGGQSDRRGVISTCNYEARRYGVHSAMASGYALKLCPQLLIVPGNMEKYREASYVMREIFQDYSDKVEPLSLDEAYIDVTDCEHHQGSATLIAKEIKQRVFDALEITVSAGVAPNKFVAKIASDWNKPDGLYVVTPAKMQGFIDTLSVKKLHGVGKVTQEKLKRLNLELCSDIKRYPLRKLIKEFGQFGMHLHKLANGIDERTVQSQRERKSLSVEHTFAEDIHGENQSTQKLAALLPELNKRLDKSGNRDDIVKAFVKIKFNDFTTTTIERLGTHPRIADYTTLLKEALTRSPLPVRLMGIGVRFKAQPNHVAQLDLFNSDSCNDSNNSLASNINLNVKPKQSNIN